MLECTFKLERRGFWCDMCSWASTSFCFPEEHCLKYLLILIKAATVILTLITPTWEQERLSRIKSDFTKWKRVNSPIIHNNPKYVSNNPRVKIHEAKADRTERANPVWELVTLTLGWTTNQVDTYRTCHLHNGRKHGLLRNTRQSHCKRPYPGDKTILNTLGRMFSGQNRMKL